MNKVGTVALIVAALVLTAGLAWADTPGQSGANAAAKAAAQASASTTPAPKPTAPAAAPNAPLAERVSTLEKQNVVLSEDLGKARLEQRLQLEDFAKKQAEAIARLNQQLSETQKQLDAEREKQAKRNRNMWIAVGALALGVLAK